jgi:hypothetical protein
MAWNSLCDRCRIGYVAADWLDGCVDDTELCGIADECADTMTAREGFANNLSAGVPGSSEDEYVHACGGFLLGGAITESLATFRISRQ